MASLLRICFSPDKKLYRSLKNILGFYPGNIALYKQAFRHSSVAQQIKQGIKDSNERLEYLGDSVLGAVVTDFLFKTFPYRDEGFLTKMRSKIVSRSSLNRISLKMGIQHFIDKNVDGISHSSINGDAFESLIGAIYLDKGYEKTRQFIVQRIIANHVDMDEVENKETDFKSKLVEWAQKEKKVLRFEIVEEAGNGNDKQYTVQVTVDGLPYGIGQHFSKKRAEQLAAELSVEPLFDQA